MSVTARPNDPMLPRGTDKCRCMECGLYFNSTYAFDKHRKGDYPERRCLSVLDLQSSGWSLSPTGHWRSPGKAVDWATVRARNDEPPEPDGECFRGGEAAAYEAEKQA